jgi:hypothetical protein
MLERIDCAFCQWWYLIIYDEDKCVGWFVPAAYGLPIAAAARALDVKPLTVKLKIYQL